MGISQKEQRQVLADFRAGAFNTLVATCIGEEGLDICQASTRPCFCFLLAQVPAKQHCNC